METNFISINECFSCLPFLVGCGNDASKANWSQLNQAHLKRLLA